MIKETIITHLKTTISNMAVSVPEISLEIPSDISHGDYTTNVAFLLVKEMKKAPKEIAGHIAAEVQRHKGAEFENVEAVNGFINFYLSKEFLTEEMEGLVKDPETAGKSDTLKGKKYIVEYSSPNIAKPFTVGHLRTTIIGDAAANLLESQGATVYRDNHVGDWGTQFGKQIYAIKHIGFPGVKPEDNIEKKNEELLDASSRPVKLLVSLYVRFHEEAEKHPEVENAAREWFKKLEDGDPEAKRLWQKCIDWSWKEFDVIYKELGVHFTENNGHGYGESYFQDKMERIIEELKQKGLLKENEGAALVFFPDKKYPPFMILKKDGATLYSTRDLATDKFRLNHYGKDIIVINEIGAEQSLYMNQLYETEYMLGWYKPGQRIHLKHGMYRFKDQKMSTRKGNVVWLEDVLNSAKIKSEILTRNIDTQSVEQEMLLNSAKNLEPSITISETARQVAIGAIKWNDLKRSPQMDIVFDWDEILTMDGNSGPYLQYTYARTQSILRKMSNVAPSQKLKSVGDKFQISNFKLKPEELELLRLLHQFSDVVSKSAEQLSPNTLATYLYAVAKSFNLFYQKYRIINAETEAEKQSRVLLTEATGIVLARGLNLLGIAAPDRM